ncbi:hypothetical protein NQ317_015594 [Molorchus minor]|uniref:Uncharacterized protein n=1 Tax=Molorchus minor TaxID=1323400 RepID=A0ABQ9JWK0_9CUCU|nr:hypothetical protein NQ317_015594 [Molorchus minor]
MSNKLPMNIQCTPSVLKGQVPNKSLVSSINAETDKLAVNSPQGAADKCFKNYNQKQVEQAIQSYIKRSKERMAAKENKKNIKWQLCGNKV